MEKPYRRSSDNYYFWVHIALMIALSIQMLISMFVTCYALYVLFRFSDAIQEFVRLLPSGVPL